MQDDREDLRLRPDGSIDTAYYMALGRRCRSDAAHDGLRAALERAPRAVGAPRPVAVAT